MVGRGRRDLFVGRFSKITHCRHTDLYQGYGLRVDDRLATSRM